MGLVSALQNAVAGLVRRRGQRAAELEAADTLRLQVYARNLLAYSGFRVTNLATSRYISANLMQRHTLPRLRYNFSRPIVNLAAGWMAADPLKWEVKDNPDAREAAEQIWTRSGAEGALLRAAFASVLLGDVAAVAAEDDAGLPRIEFLDPAICFPTFDPSDYQQLKSLEVRYEGIADDGAPVLISEFYGPTERALYHGDALVEQQSYDVLPVVWIRNQELMGWPYGISDLDCVIDLVEEYDHVAGKQTKIIDYHAAPVPVFKGIKASEIEKHANTAYFLPTDGSAEFLEWKGDHPDIDRQLTRIRNALAEMSETPPVAFGQADSGLTSISGVALQILYGPLIGKTRRRQAFWSPPLQRLMWLCLQRAGFDVPLDSVRPVWGKGLPVDGQARVAEEASKVAAELSSRKSAMTALGVEDPDAELKRIVLEEKILQLAGPPPDPSAVAKAAAKGNTPAILEGPASVQVKPLPPGPAAQAFGGADIESSIAELLAVFDRLAEAGNADPAPEGAAEGSDGTAAHS